MSNSKEIMKNLSKALDMPPLSVNIEQSPIINTPVIESTELSPQEKEAETDFQTVRDNQIEIINNGLKVLEEATKVAIGSQQPRVFETVAQVLKSLSEANQGLLALHESRRALTPSKESEKETSANTINNNTIIVSSPAELLDMVYQKRKMQEQLDHESNDTK